MGSYFQYTGNKYGAKKTIFNGRKFDSKFEAGVAQGLELRKRAGEILDYDCQYKVELPIYNKDGVVVMKKNWRVDFRVHEKDSSFTLVEAKGVETPDYKWKRDLLINVWLHENQDYKLEVVKQNNWRC